MTELIDLCFIKQKDEPKKGQDLQKSAYDSERLKLNQINRTLEKMLHRIDKNYIKIQEIYFFHIDRAKIKEQQPYWYDQFKLYASITVKHKIFTFKFFFLDTQGCKIQPKSIHHRAFLSNFVLEMNAQLQNFKLQYNPETGELNFAFNLSSQHLDEISVTDLVDYALQSYFEQSEAHFFILNLIERINLPQNQFLSNIEQDCNLLKRWLRERRIQSLKLKRQFNALNIFPQSHQMSRNQQSKPKRLQINEIEDYFIHESKKFKIQKEPNPNTLKQIYRQFKGFYKEQEIFSRHLANKSKFKNYIQIQATNLSNINQFLQITAIDQTQDKGRHPSKLLPMSQNFYHQNKSKNIQTNGFQSLQNEKIRIWDKNSGKNYLLKFFNLGQDLAKKEEIILQKLSKLDSFLFFNQYVSINKMDLSQNGYIAINANSSQISLSEFLKNNDRITSLAVKLDLCINLVEIFFTLNMKSKIANYFPVFSCENIAISKNLSLNIKHLSRISSFPLLELINTISRLLFQKSFCIRTGHQNETNIFKGDEIENKFYGISIHISIIKYYLIELYYEAISLMKLQSLRSNKSNKTQQNQRYDYWTKQTLLRSCQQLLVIFNHCKNALFRGYESDFHNLHEDLSDND